MPRPPVDLHTHSTASDGSLAPAELVAAAAERGVACLALTDHDTCAGLAEAGEAARRLGVRFVNGIELSSFWEKTGVHLVGLGLDPEHGAMTEAQAHQRNARRRRAEDIARRLQRQGLGELLEAARARAGRAEVGRPHFARALVANGQVATEAEAFKKYLGAGKAGDVRAHWPGLEEAIGWIHRAGGVAVLAHPGKYDLSWTKVRRLVAAFVAAGGEALEVSYGNENPQRVRELIRLAQSSGLRASVGSDFHSFQYSWTAPGRYPPVPVPVEGVWQDWLYEVSEGQVGPGGGLNT